MALPITSECRRRGYSTSTGVATVGDRLLRARKLAAHPARPSPTSPDQLALAGLGHAARPSRPGPHCQPGQAQPRLGQPRPAKASTATPSPAQPSPAWLDKSAWRYSPQDVYQPATSRLAAAAGHQTACPAWISNRHKVLSGSLDGPICKSHPCPRDVVFDSWSMINRSGETGAAGSMGHNNVFGRAAKWGMQRMHPDQRKPLGHCVSHHGVGHAARYGKTPQLKFPYHAGVQLPSKRLPFVKALQIPHGSPWALPKTGAGDGWVLYGCARACAEAWRSWPSTTESVQSTGTQRSWRRAKPRRRGKLEGVAASELFSCA